MRKVEVAASITTSNFANLYRVVRRLERAGVDRLHLDVMDGNFVPNITFGPDVIAAIRRITKLRLDAHLMIAEPARYIERFIHAGADTLTFHHEVGDSLARKRQTLAIIRAAGRAPGIAINPKTTASVLSDYVDDVALVTVMTVEPGFGGQHFMPGPAAKIAEARRFLRGRPEVEVHVDGGVSSDTAAVVGGYGVNVCVVGSALFKRGRDPAVEVKAVKRAAGSAPYDPRA